MYYIHSLPSPSVPYILFTFMASLRFVEITPNSISVEIKNARNWKWKQNVMKFCHYIYSLSKMLGCVRDCIARHTGWAHVCPLLCTSSFECRHPSVLSFSLLKFVASEYDAYAPRWYRYTLRASHMNWRKQFTTCTHTFIVMQGIFFRLKNFSPQHSCSTWQVCGWV